MSYRQIISSHLYVRSKGTCSLAGRALKLRGLSEYIYTGLRDKVSISKAAWSNYRTAGHMWPPSFLIIDLMLCICCSGEFIGTSI